MKKKVVGTFFLSFILISCGSDDSSSNHDSLSSDNDAPVDGDTVVFYGYIPSAFEVVVDGEPYFDLEDFYTKELLRLPKKVKDAGYSDVYRITFDAEIGFSDLWNDMTVYVVSAETRGYLGESKVSNAGQFEIEFPPEADNANYKIRANKRINVILSSSEEIISLCYNFSAQERSFLLSQAEKLALLKVLADSLASEETDTKERKRSLTAMYGVLHPDDGRIPTDEELKEEYIAYLLEKYQ